MARTIDQTLLNAFQEACEAANGEWYGEYSGRSSFKGYGAVFDGSADLVRLGGELREDLPDLLLVTPHIDSMGRGLIIAWPTRCFEE